MALSCQAGFLYCGEVAVQQCVICRRYFCAKHGDAAAPHCRHCAGAYAEQQRLDMATAGELARRDLAGAHNGAGHCGWAACEGPLLARCQHCGLEYCSRHSTLYRYSYRYRTRRGVETRHASVTLCDACKPALKIYKREKTWLEV